MADRVEVNDVTCAASVQTGNPTVLNLLGVVACSVEKVTIRIPPGHAGLTGIALGYGLNQVLPRRIGAFISGDDEVIEYDLSRYIDGPQWQVFLVNVDGQPHNWEVRFEVNELTDVYVSPTSSVIPVADIYQAGSSLVGTV